MYVAFVTDMIANAKATSPTRTNVRKRAATKSPDDRTHGSRQRILEAAASLMAEEGSYAATSISAICLRCGLPPTSIYWHFKSKEGLLAAVIEDGAERWFSTFFDWEEPSGTLRDRFSEVSDRLADSLAQEPQFLRLLLMLSLERKNTDACLVPIRRVRDKALDRLSALAESALILPLGPARARKAARELARFALAFSDGAFLAHHIDPEATNLRRLFEQLRTALLALGERLTAPPGEERSSRARRL
jgi:AcrR family transcriptional regulator